jgi:hypothetical protein
MSAIVSLTCRAKMLAILGLSSLCSLCLCGASSAALDAETKKPYQVTIVLHVAEHRLLTGDFRDRVEREVRDGLQAALGDLAEVKVVREHPKLAEVLEKGLRSLDGWNDRTPVKTHFVLIDFSGVNYELEARQYDGQTGTATPVVRREKTQSREFVARTAVLMIERDFGISATFQSWPPGQKPQKVTLELKGGGLDAPLNRWVQKGDIFAVVAIPTGNGIGRVVSDAIVQIETPPSEGAATCEGNLFWRREPPRGAVAGFRCIKLGTTRGPLQVRLVQVKPDGSPGELLSTPTLVVRRHGFTGEKDTLLELQPARNKVNSYDTTNRGDKGQFDGVAFVTVTLSGEPKAQIPIVILDDQPVVVPVSLTEKDTEPIEYRKGSWKQSVIDSYRVQAETFNELQEMSAKKDTPRADLIAKAKEGAKRSTDDLLRLQEERKELFGDAKTVSDADRRDLALAEQRLTAIREGAAELGRYADRQVEIEKEENSPERKRLQEEIERGKLLERDGEVGKAIKVYETVLESGIKNEELEARLKKLQEIWKEKSPAHATARKYIYDVFPTLDTAALQMQIKDANDALDECIRAGDVITPQKLYKGIQIHAARLLKEGEALQDKVGEEDMKQLKMLRDLGAELGKMEAKIKAFLEKAPKP